MTTIELRNVISFKLSQYLGVPVYLSDQVAPTQKPPFMHYTITTPYTPTSGLRGGEHVWSETSDGILDTRYETAHCTISFTVCSVNRWREGIEPPEFVSGDDEAQSITNQALSYLEHTGYYELSREGIVVVDIMDVGDRSFFMVDEQMRQYGFDCRFRYTRTSERLIPAITNITASISTHQETNLIPHKPTQRKRKKLHRKGEPKCPET